jgi:hypothetical protein
MELQNREPHEAMFTEDHDEQFVSENFVRSVVIGAILGGVGFLLYRLITQRKFHHTIPPIIIRSVEEAPEPIEIETENILGETSALTEGAGSSTLSAKLYRMAGFGLTRYVVVDTGSGSPTRYKKNTGLVVKMWLEHKQGNQWLQEPNGPHLVVNGTSVDFPLTCEQLSPDKPNPGNPFRPRKRSFNRNKNWRIWQVQVDSNAAILSTSRIMEIRFDNHYQ